MQVPFRYREANVDKEALVKLRVCPECAYKLHYPRIKRLEKRLGTGKAQVRGGWWGEGTGAVVGGGGRAQVCRAWNSRVKSRVCAMTVWQVQASHLCNGCHAQMATQICLSAEGR